MRISCPQSNGRKEVLLNKPGEKWICCLCNSPFFQKYSLCSTVSILKDNICPSAPPGVWGFKRRDSWRPRIRRHIMPREKRVPFATLLGCSVWLWWFRWKMCPRESLPLSTCPLTLILIDLHPKHRAEFRSGRKRFYFKSSSTGKQPYMASQQGVI